MKVKRFLAPTMQQALRMVRDEMGADAVILSNRKIDGGVEIVTALNYDEQAARKAVAPDPELPPGRVASLQAERHVRLQEELERTRTRVQDVRQRQDTPVRPARVERPAPARTAPAWDDGFSTLAETDFDDALSAQPASAPAPAVSPVAAQDPIEQMRAEIQALRAMMQQNVASAPVAPAAPVEAVPAPRACHPLTRQRLQERLEDLGLSSVLAGRYAEHHAHGRLDEGWKSALKDLAGDLQAEAGEWVDQGGIIALVGPTGAGKTTTIGKLAARYVLRHGADSLALVTTDRYRIAGHEQLCVFGRILGVPVRIVDEQNPLDSILDSLADKHLVLIDTAGLTAADKSWEEQCRELRRSRHPLKPYLVVSATSQPRIMKSTWHAYRAIGLSGCVLTKLDEALSLGEVLGFAVESDLALAYVTDGQRIPQDIHPAAPVALVKRAVTQLRQLDEQRRESVGA